MDLFRGTQQSLFATPPPAARPAGPLRVTDIDGKSIEVTDLPGAIAQAEEMAGYTHQISDGITHPIPEKHRLYWNDLLQKLKNHL
jgi:hypothetical protein